MKFSVFLVGLPEHPTINLLYQVVYLCIEEENNLPSLKRSELDRSSAFQQQRQRSGVMKSNMAARGKFKSRNLFRLLLLLNVTFPLSSKTCN